MYTVKFDKCVLTLRNGKIYLNFFHAHSEILTDVLLFLSA